MTQTYTKLLVTKLSQGTHDTLIELARKERRSLSGMSRVIIEDYFEALDRDHSQEQA
jgi:hypothetical protein